LQPQIGNIDVALLWLQVALQQADYVAWNIWASICNRPLLPFKYQHLGTMMTLGASTGAVTLNVPVPSGARAA
jgi:demethylphylloquinone reductase